MIEYLDLTSLSLDDTDESILALCQRACQSTEPPAAVCVHPKFIPLAKKALLQTSIKVATVINFPDGSGSLSEVKSEIEAAKANGADELDLVIPYQKYLQDLTYCITTWLRDLRSICGQTPLKIILESGAFENLSRLKQCCTDVLAADVAFLKTSTGKIHTGATLEAAEVILGAIAEHKKQTGKVVGFKASGGIRTEDTANSYLSLAEKIMGKAYLSSKTFRFGVSAYWG